jgi:hypothetical protein
LILSRSVVPVIILFVFLLSGRIPTQIISNG